MARRTPMQKPAVFASLIFMRHYGMAVKAMIQHGQESCAELGSQLAVSKHDELGGGELFVAHGAEGVDL